jgi:PAS domain S-box-containing protein
MLNNLLKRLRKPLALEPIPALKMAGEDIGQSTLDELLNAKTRLNAIYNASFDAISMLGDDGFIEGNRAAMALFGCANLDEFCRHHPIDLSPATQACGTDSKTLSQHYIDLTLKNGSCRFEWLYHRADNGIVFVTEVMLSSLEVNGATIIQCVHHDLTRRRNTEANLATKKKKNKALKKTLYEQALFKSKFKETSVLQDAIFNSHSFSSIATDAQGVIQIFNVGAEAMLGYSAAEVINIFTPAYLSDQNELNARADILSQEFGVTISSGFEALVYKAALGIEDIYELTYLCKNGTRLLAQVSVTALRDENAVIIGYLLIGIDHTEQTAIKIAARQQLKTLSLALEQSQSGVMIADLNNNIEYINQAFINSLGYIREDIIGQNPRRFISGKTLEKTYVDMWAALNEGRAWQGELINLNKQGEEIVEQTWISPIRQEDGTISHYLSVKDNITERKQKDAELIAAKERSENLAKTKTQFLANMSHEIRTPMNAIIGFSELALLEDMPPQVNDYLQNINVASNHLLIILNDILDLSKLEAGQMGLNLGPFSLYDLQTTLYNLFSNTAQSKGLVLNIDIASDVPDYLIGDSIRLRQVLINLLGNGIKFTSQGTVALNISLQHFDDQQAKLLFAVTDSGIGITLEQQAKLFLPFSQVDDGYTRNYEGTGLGLVISQDLVQLMGSIIKVESYLGISSCFSFELQLPIAPLSTLAAIETPSSTVQSALRTETAALNGIKILVAEDDGLNQIIIRQVLKHLGASFIMMANNGSEVLSALEQDDFDVVLMDLHMPIMNGYDAAIEIRKFGRYAQLPIIALSAGITDEDKQRCMAAGMNDVMAKPINVEVLLSILAQWLKQ